MRHTASNGDYIGSYPSVSEDVINLFSQPQQGSQPTQGQVQPQPAQTNQGAQAPAPQPTRQTQGQQPTQTAQVQPAPQDPVQVAIDQAIQITGSVQAAQKAMDSTIAKAKKRLDDINKKIETANIDLTDPKSVETFGELRKQAEQQEEIIALYTQALQRLEQQQAPQGETTNTQPAQDTQGADNSSQGEAGGQRSPRDVAIGEQGEAGERPADGGRGTGSNGGQKVDNQGNPIDENGKLITEKVDSIDELTNEDFTNPTRSVELPRLPEAVSNAIGANGKPVIIKKNIFVKNKGSHGDLSPQDSKEIIKAALYSPQLYGQNKKISRPYNWILIHLANQYSSIVIEVNNNKDNYEIVSWHYLDDETLQQKRNQAVREGGLILTLPQNGNAAGNTSENSKVSTPKDTQSSRKNNAYTIEPAQYVTKRGKVLDMFLVKFPEPLTKERQQAAKEIAKSEKGWYDREEDGFMMRSKEAALRDALAERLQEAGIEVEYVSEARLQELSELSGAKLEAKRKSEARRKRDEQNHAIDHVTSLITGLTEKEARQERLRWEQQRRDLAKEIYEAALQGNFNDVTLQKINKYIDESTPKNTFGRRISQRVPQKMERSLHEGTRTNAVDALFTRISESAVGDAGTKLARNRSEREGAKEIKKELLKGWAIATGNWHTDIHDFTNDTAPLAQGRDSSVYKSKDGRHVIKFSKGKSDKRFSTDIDAANLFSFVFPNTAYDILGYGEIDGNFVTILQQPVVDIERALTEQERVDYMRSLGFNPINKENTAFSNGDIVAADIQKGNVVYDKDGNVSVLDADVKLHTKDIGGAYTYLPAATDTEQRIDSEQPKFQRDENSVIYGAAYKGKIYLNAERLSLDTPIHEYTHLWAEALRRGNRREWDSIVDMLRGTPQWNETKQRYPELTTDDRIAEETLALYSGMRGAQRLREQQQKIASEARSIRETVTAMGAIARVKQALKRFWKNVAGFLHLHYESVDEVADKVLSDMLDGVNPIYMATTVKVTPITKRFANFEEAKAWAKKHIARVYDNTETGGKGNIEISKRAIDKYFSSSAVSKSDNAEVHKAVVSVLPEVIKESIVGEIHPDYLKKDGVRSPENGSNPGTEIHRLFGAVSIDGQIYRVKTTVKYLKKEATTTKFIHTKW